MELANTQTHMEDLPLLIHFATYFALPSGRQFLLLLVDYVMFTLCQNCVFEVFLYDRILRFKLTILYLPLEIVNIVVNLGTATQLGSLTS